MKSCLKYQKIIVVVAVMIFVSLSWYCSTSTKPAIKERTTYAGLSDSAKYVGMNTCKGCHSGIHSTFVHTGMGLSFDTASMQKSSAEFKNSTVIYDKFKDLYYHPYWNNDRLYFQEYRLNGPDTIHSRTEQIKYIVGSGQHTNSHIWENNGYLFQAPLTFYTQNKKWDLPPGFEDGNNSRFNRIIGLECMSCHNGYPNFVEGSENKYEFVKNGIDCERCHGPGSVHVQEKSSGILIDTSKYIDYSIVNPSKLPIDLQFDVCQRCHIQGNAVVKDGKSFFDFKPGMKLSDVMDVYMPVYEGNEHEHIMASHAERLKLSKCYISTINKNTAISSELRPGKNALTCITCHNPHVSVKQTNKAIFNTTCNTCHDKKIAPICNDKKENILATDNNCVKCHMEFSGASDIPHVSVHDHRIAIPAKKVNQKSIQKFLGINAINNLSPTSESKAQAYINYFEKFGKGIEMLDSSLNYLSFVKNKNERNVIAMYIQIYYLKKDYNKVIQIVSSVKDLSTKVHVKQIDNYYAWTNYRIGESYQQLGDIENSLFWFKNAYDLAPLYSEFSNKYANALINSGNTKQARIIFESLVKEHPTYAPGYSNLGYLYLVEDQNPQKAMEFYNRSLALDPDYIQALINKAGLLMIQNNKKDAIAYLNRVLKINPNEARAKSVLVQLKKTL
jgi:tetratricopeptide (TPR) repeat protein